MTEKPIELSNVDESAELMPGDFHLAAQIIGFLNQGKPPIAGMQTDFNDLPKIDFNSDKLKSYFKDDEKIALVLALLARIRRWQQKNPNVKLKQVIYKYS